MQLNLLVVSLICLLSFSNLTFGQVGISKQDAFKPNEAAILDVSSTDKGILIPRVTLTSSTILAPVTTTGTIPNSLLVYNTATAGTIPDNVTPGFYYWEGSRWVRLINKENEAKPVVFYAPSIALPTKESSTSYTINLYDEYLKQYTLTDSSTSKKSDPNATLPTYGNTDLYYFITYYDKDVFTNVNISNNGILTYNVTSTGEAAVSEKTYMNVVFKVKN